jgi:general secretion pathway protein D
LKVNYVISPKVTGKVSLQTTRALAEDEMVPTLEMLLKTNGAVLIHEHGLYRIEPEAGATVSAPSTRLGLAGQSSQPGFQLRVVPLRYVGVAEMQKVIEPLMPPKSVVRADEARNLLLLAGTPDELDSVLETIRIFDVDFMRGMSVGLFPLKNVEAGTVAEELDKLLTVSGKGPLSGMFRILPIERLQSILVVTPQPRYLDEVRTWIDRLDRYNTAKTSNMHVYKVQNVDALELANTLSNIFGQQRGGGAGRTPGASLAPGLTGSSVSGGADYSSSGTGGRTGGTPSSGFGGSSSTGTGFGGSSTGTGFGGSSTGTGFGGSSTGTGFGSSSTGTGFGGAGGGFGSSSGGGFGGSSGGGFGSGFGGASGGGGQGRSRSSMAVDLGNNMKIVADPANNALIIMAKPQEYRDIEAVLKELDVIPLQVLIDATVVEVSLTDSLQYGLQWLFTHGDSAAALTTATNANTLTDAAAIVAGASSGGFAYALAGNNIKLLMNALAQDNKINVISSPSLMVLNNQEANINVGDKVPTPTGTSTNLNSGSTSTGNPYVTSTIQYQESGVTLRVRPRVNAGGLVTMDILQEISTPNPTTVGGVQTYQFAQRKIQSQVAVVGGDTLALGGLISDRHTDTQNGIPYLNQLPWIGC